MRTSTQSLGIEYPALEPNAPPFECIRLSIEIYDPASVALWATPSSGYPIVIQDPLMVLDLHPDRNVRICPMIKDMRYDPADCFCASRGSLLIH